MIEIVLGSELGEDMDDGGAFVHFMYSYVRYD